jgi:ATP/maltotriose-dependent transcriptional regulator MalT
LANRSDYTRQAEARSFRPAVPRDELTIASRLITDRQLQCLSWVQEGKSATDIGSILGLSGRTVEKHIIKVCGHLGVKTRIQAVVRARELGLITTSTP